MKTNKKEKITLKLTAKEISYLNSFLEAQTIKLSFLNEEAKKNKPVKEEFKILEALETKLAVNV